MRGLDQLSRPFKLVGAMTGICWLAAFSAWTCASEPMDSESVMVSTAFSNLLNPQTTVFTDKTSFVIPFTTRHGFEYIRTNDERYSNDWVELSYVTALDNDYFGTDNHHYSETAPLLLKVTLKGYNLLQSESGDGEFFSYDQRKEQEIREPHLSVSVSKNF